jgi:dTDP-4-dehydrorhamnose 3,5-epimerase
LAPFFRNFLSFEGIAVFTKGQIEGVLIRSLVKHSDRRGWLTELFRQDEIPAENMPAMGYVSATEPGVARGPHEHREQADGFCFVGPSTFRVFLWDNRPQSPTYRNRMTFEVGESNPQYIIVPPGVVHAYKNIGLSSGWVIDLPNRLYAGSGRKETVDEVRHEDDKNTLFVMDIS